jgi:ubiquinone/menaquinone biosynthesis C-methylase UbiE
MDDNDKHILDVCCGGRMMWFDKNNKNTLYCDIREVEKGKIEHCPNWECKPDIIADYKDLPFDDNSFKLIVWDIPHIIKDTGGILNKKYGSLGNNWKEDTKKAFDSIWRVLDVHGTLIFKYSDLDIKVTDMLKLFPQKALFGTRTKRAVNSTYWIVFFKTE